MHSGRERSVTCAFGPGTVGHSPHRGDPLSCAILNREPVRCEGDDSGECANGADNDQDGALDCEDPDCSGSADCPEGDADTDGGHGSGGDFLVDFSGTCDSTSCDYTITSSHEAILLELDMTETGDAYLYHEYHDEFVLDSVNSDGSETYLLHLDAVTDLNDVTSGTTLFFGASTLAQITWVFAASDARGTFDCVVLGENVAYYSSLGCRVL